MTTFNTLWEFFGYGWWCGLMFSVILHACVLSIGVWLVKGLLSEASW